MLVLNDVTLDGRLQSLSAVLNPAQQLHVLGANGAGKSSLLQVLAGSIEASDGQVQFLGQAMQQWSLSELASLRCLLRQQQSSAFGLTVAETLAFFGAPACLPDDIEQALEISAFMHRPLNVLSGGEQRRVHLARVLLQIWPAICEGQGLILLDEPDQGLDFRHQHGLFSLLGRLSAEGNLVVCSHHNLNLAQAYADTVWLLKRGELSHQGPVAEIMQSKKLETVFDCRVDRFTDNQQNVYFRTF